MNPNSQIFNWPDARAALAFCRQAYNGSAPGATICTAPATDTLALVWNLPDRDVVAFRGSRNLNDWIQDLKCAKQHPTQHIGHWDDDVEVHAGFWQDVASVIDDVLKVLSRPDKPVFLTGHSKGAAECMLAAMELQQSGYEIFRVINFGCPRVGDKDWADFCDSHIGPQTFRVVNQNDIVPRLPGYLMGYRHAGNEMFLPVGGGYDLNPPLWSKILSDAIGLWGAFRGRGDALLVDHHIASYQQRIQLLT